MNNTQLVANDMAPLPVSFENTVKLYLSSWRNFKQAEKALAEEAQHPDNFTSRGALTKRGIRVIRKLFAMGIEDSDIADLMDMNQSSVFRRRQEHH
jgi:hypothetical protein